MKLKTDFWVFTLSLLFFGTVGFSFAYHTLLPYHPKYIYDLYLGFDNTFHNTSALRHPLLKILSIFLKKIPIPTVYISYFLVSISAVLLSFQNFFIAKYLKSILKIKIWDLFIILFLFSVLSTNLILCFTFESYLFTTFLFSIFLYYQAKEQQISNFKTFIFSGLIGGITVTNFFKVLIITFIEKKRYLIFAIIFFLIFILLGGVLFWPQIQKSILHILIFFQSGSVYWKDVFFYFLGGSVVFPDLKITKILYENKDWIDIIITTYPKIISLKAFIILIFWAIIIFSAIKNFDKKLVKALVYCFFIDIFIHCILKLGLNEAMIFGGNYIFIFPLLLGLFLKQYPQVYIKFFLMILMVYLAFININELIYLFEFGKTYYPKR